MRERSHTSCAVYFSVLCELNNKGDKLKEHKKTFVYICLLASIFILFFDFFKYDIYNKADARSFGAGLAFGFLIYAVYGVYCFLAIGTLFYIVLRIKQYMWKALIPSMIMAVAILLLTFVPYTKSYVNAFYFINKDHLQETVQMYTDGELQDFIRGDEYIVPYRLTSYTGKMGIQKSQGSVKIEFYAYRGFFNKTVIIYSSDDSSISPEDFTILGYKINYRNIRRIDINWYSAVIS
jgi:hypothetical protein